MVNETELFCRISIAPSSVSNPTCWQTPTFPQILESEGSAPSDPQEVTLCAAESVFLLKLPRCPMKVVLQHCGGPLSVAIR